MDIKENDKELLRNKHKEEFESMIKEYTRNEFIKNVVRQGICPLFFGLDNTEKCNAFKISCTECWGNAVKDIKFKDDKRKTWIQETMEHIEPIVKEKLQQAINNYLEGDKMEDKTIKVRCTDNTNLKEKLNINGIYIVEEEFDSSYILKGICGYQFDKDRFEKVEDVLMVECIDNGGYEGHLELNKKYPVLEEDETYYFINDEILKGKTGYRKDRFKPVEQQKEYSVMEIFQEEDRTEFKDSRDIIVYPATIGLNKYLIDKASGTEIRVSEKLLKDKFTKVEEPKPVSTAEAFKALEEGKIIESCSGYQYKKENGKIKCKCRDVFVFRNISIAELEGQWIVKGDK